MVSMHTDLDFMRLALRLARRGYGSTSPNPMVGAVLVKGAEIIGRGWHHRAGEPHAEIEALRDAEKRKQNPRGATLYVTLEPCCTQGRTPPCTDAVLAAGIKRVIVGATDPNPSHCGKAFQILRRSGIAVTKGVLGEECERLNEAFNHWIVHRTPFVTVKAAMTLDGKIATASGESRWITGEQARAYGMKLRQGADAILVGINTVLADDPSLTVRGVRSAECGVRTAERRTPSAECGARNRVRRIVLDALARVPLHAKIVTDEHAPMTTIVVSASAPARRVAALSRRVKVITAPDLGRGSRLRVSHSKPGSPIALDLRWLLKQLGSEDVTSLLVEGGGEVNASFLLQRLAHRIAFFYAPKILGGRDSLQGVAGPGAEHLSEALSLAEVEWRRLGPDFLLMARLAQNSCVR